ncbi:uncharacterized protein K444DRAFT_526058 [Hyaloscypha bicolor E]|uniref:DUF7624 domain-containing protein n=1 Tax=Hyaloscypha bicolor E TaxID=1095630 RepID=A0A2J6TF67_9HELO|nr:uncharacterized protein K444DRAFT_526058 [Hyaloscypha bicolor E]PMD61674.1 hypothetical protein K444DRAFT_526058 [Hyaloscypha bicolor E]
MALESPLVPSPRNILSAFSPYTSTDFSMSPRPDSPHTNSPRFSSLSAHSSAGSSNLRPSSRDGSTKLNTTNMNSPLDMVGPSPVTSNGTETTEIEDEVAPELRRLTTHIPDYFRTDRDEDDVTSVIHAPEGFGSFVTQTSPISPPPITTDIKPVAYGLENATPRAKTRQEVDAFAGKGDPMSRSVSRASLQGIPEDQSETDVDESEITLLSNSALETSALKTALNECWTLCNTLASLSSIHRERIFSYSGTGAPHEKAWKCCWKLCQKLYDSRDEDHESHVRPTLDLCRDFCQALFDVRQKKDEIADSVLRVSFELNNHLFNTHDRSLPEAFRERTLDFYITLCHRLMKQRNELAEETDALLRACWGLAEMLFSLRQNKREGKAADEELLGSAVQACWELCDLFREGWTQVRPERGTPRPSQTTFTQISEQISRSAVNKGNLASLPENPEHPDHARTRYLPETPTTEFEDTPISPEDNSPNIPNILVLGTEGNRAATARWSSTTSTLSSYSQGSERSQKSTSTITSTTSPEDVNLTRLKILILKAAMNVGFSRSTPTTATPNKADPPALQIFVKSLPTGSFGSLPAHATLLASYRNLVLSDPTFRSANSLPPVGRKATAVDVAKSVGWMMKSGQYTFLKDLFKLVFGFPAEEAETRKTTTIIV